MGMGIPASVALAPQDANNAIALTQASTANLKNAAASNAIALVQVAVGEGVFNLQSKLGVSGSTLVGSTMAAGVPALPEQGILGAVSTIVLSQLTDATGPSSRAGISPITLTDEAAVVFNVFGRLALTDIDIDGAQPVDGGLAESSIKDLTAVTPDPQTDDPNDLPTFTQNWGNAARLTDTFDLTASNTIVLSQTLPQPTGKRSVDAVNTLNVLDFADTKEKTRSVVNTISVLQVATAFKVHRAVNTLALTVTVEQGFVNLFAENILDLNQIVRPGPIDRSSVTDIDIDGTWGNAATSSIKNLDASSPITLVQDINVQRPFRLDVENKISGITDDIFVPPSGPVIPGVPFGLSDEATVQISPVRNPENLITIGDLAQVVHIKFDAVAKAATSPISFTQVANLSETADAETVIDSLQVIANAALNTSDALNSLTELSDQAIFSIVRDALPADNIIDLKHAVGFSLISDTTECDYTPFIGESDAGTVAPRPELPEVRIPVLPGIRFRLVSPPFDTGAAVDTLDLRAPVFGNRERLEPTRIQRETQGGTLTVFADPVWPKVHSLEMQFTALKTAQARALLNFIERHLGEEIGIYDYEGRIWKGIITNPDEAVVHDGRENYSATLQIEAERIFT